MATDSDAGTGEYRREIPIPSPVSQPYWDACRRHELRGQRCRTCNWLWMYPSRMCHNPDCNTLDDYDWEQLAGTGTVWTFTVNHRAPNAEWEDDLPYVFGVIELDEGVMITSNVIGCDPSEVHIGMPVEVVFEDVSDEISLPKFRPRSS